MTDSSERSTDGAKSDLSGWPALVLTAGLATRLQPLSRVRAKAALMGSERGFQTGRRSQPRVALP